MPHLQGEMMERPTRAQLLDTAKQIVTRDRAATHGDAAIATEPQA